LEVYELSKWFRLYASSSSFITRQRSTLNLLLRRRHRLSSTEDWSLSRCAGPPARAGWRRCLRLVASPAPAPSCCQQSRGLRQPWGL